MRRTASFAITLATVAVSVLASACANDGEDDGGEPDTIIDGTSDTPKLAREYSLVGRSNGDVLAHEFHSLHLLRGNENIGEESELPDGFVGRAIRGVGGDCGPDCYKLGPYKYSASASGKTYLRFYDEANEFSARYEYKSDGDQLKLRRVGTGGWFVMQRDRDGGESCDGGVQCSQAFACLPVDGCDIGAPGCRMTCQ